MKIKTKYIVEPLIIAVCMLVYYYYLFYSLDYFKTLRYKSADLLAKISNFVSDPPKQTNEIVVMAIDEDSLAALDVSYPIKRDSIANFVKKISSCGPKMIFLNVLLSREIPGEENNDKMLAEEFKNAKNIILPTYYDVSGKRIAPLKIFADAAKKIGFINKVKDWDMTMRRCVLFHLSSDKGIDEYALEQEMASELTGKKEQDFIFSSPPDNNSKTFEEVFNENKYKIPVQSDGSLLINFRATPRDFTNVLLADFLAGGVDQSIVKDKIVIVTDISDIEGTVYNTPIGMMPGVYICANELIMLLSGEYISHVGFKVSVALSFVFVVFAAFLPFWAGKGRGILVAAVAMVLIFAGSFFAFTKGLLVDYFSILASGIISYIASSFLKYIIALQEKIEELKIAYTKLREAQDELIKKEQLSSIGKMTAKILHEIKSPIGNIRSSLELLNPAIKGNARAERVLNLADGEIVRLIELSEDLRNTYTPHAEDKKEVDINEFLGEIIEITRKRFQEKNVKLSAVLGDNIPRVSVSPSKIKQVFVNIINNAFEALGSGGEISVSSGVETKNGKFVRVSIRDNGSGISERDLPRIFDAFYTTKKESKGSGLGLFICKEIIKAHNGSLDVQSRSGAGTVFNVLLPLS